MSRHFKTVIAAVAMLGFVGAATVNAQPAPKNPPQADDNKATNPSGQNKTKNTMPKTKPDAMKNAPKGKNAPQADDNKETNPAGKK